MTKRLIAPGLIALILLGLSLAACGGGSSGDGPTYAPELIAEGEGYYQSTCAACHGPEGKGIENLGKTLIGSVFVTENDDAALLDYIKVGRGVDDPLNTTGIAMPPKGGNPALADDQINAIIAFMRSIQE